MTSLARHLYASAHNNAWANHRLLQACGQLTQDEFSAPRTGFFPSIRATLNHNLTVDDYYLDAIERSLRGDPPHPAPGSFFDPEEPCATCAELVAAQQRMDQRLLAVAHALLADGALLERVIEVPRTRRIDREPLHRLLAHLYQHQVHHRGQAHSMLSGTRVAPPQLDEFFCVNDLERREGNFRALGVTEASIWHG
jgi:uncharacterized damage-inducible protein DinB